MKSHLFRSAVVVSIILAGVFVLAIAAGSGGTLIMTMDRVAAAVMAGEHIGGAATDVRSDLVVVKMYIDGELVAEDNNMEGASNLFMFDIPEDAEGKELKIVATSSTGTQVERVYTVRPGRG